MAMTVVIDVSDTQQTALEWVAGGPANAEAYLQARNNEMLETYVRNYNIQSAPVPPLDMATAYVYATPDQQNAALAALGIPTTPQLILSDVWTWSTQTSLPPNNGQLRTDTGNWSAATILHIDDFANGGTDHTTALTTLQVSDVITVQHNTDPTRTATFTVAQPSTARPEYAEVQVTYTGGSGTVPNSGTNTHITIERPVVSTSSHRAGQMSSDLQAAGVPG
jgi:hypothetical protein